MRNTRPAATATNPRPIEITVEDGRERPVEVAAGFRVVVEAADGDVVEMVGMVDDMMTRWWWEETYLTMLNVAMCKSSITKVDVCVRVGGLTG